MSSTLRKESSRANGAKSLGPVTPEGKRVSAANSARSTGPTTPEGKARSSGNAVRHGMLAKSVVLGSESAKLFAAHLADLHAELKPEPGIESRLVDTMAVASWRQTRLWGMEKLQLDTESRTQGMYHADDSDAALSARAFRSICDDSNSLELLNRYGAHCDRQYHRSLDRFLAYRDERRKKAKDVFTEQTEPNLG